MKKISSRRSFIVSATIVSASVVWVASSKLPNLLSEETTSAVGRLPSELGQLGKMYLAKVPEENSVEKLSEFLVDHSRNVEHLSQKQFKSLVQQKITSDFASFNTTELDGWILARTEARICALAFLSV